MHLMSKLLLLLNTVRESLGMHVSSWDAAIRHTIAKNIHPDMSVNVQKITSLLFVSVFDVCSIEEGIRCPAKQTLGHRCSRLICIPLKFLFFLINLIKSNQKK